MPLLFVPKGLDVIMDVPMMAKDKASFELSDQYHSMVTGLPPFPSDCLDMRGFNTIPWQHGYVQDIDADKIINFFNEIPPFWQQILNVAFLKTATYKMMSTPEFEPKAKTFAVAPDSAMGKQFKAELLKKAKFQTDGQRGAYNVLSTCPPYREDCQVAWKCIFKAQFGTGPKEQCLDCMKNIQANVTEWSAPNGMRDELMKYMTRIASPEVSGAFVKVGCGGEAMDPMKAMMLDPCTPVVMMAIFPQGAGRRLSEESMQTFQDMAAAAERGESIFGNSKHFGDESVLEDIKEKAGVDAGPGFQWDFQPPWDQKAGEGRRLSTAGSKDSSKTAALFGDHMMRQMKGMGELLESAAKDTAEKIRLPPQEEAYWKPKTDFRSVMAKDRGASVADSAWRDRAFMQPRHFNGTSSGSSRFLEDDEGSSRSCNEIEDTCECAAAYKELGCQYITIYRKWPGTGKCKSKGQCLAKVDTWVRQALSEGTSCWECDSQGKGETCKPNNVWSAVGILLGKMEPHVKLFADMDAIEDYISQDGYEMLSEKVGEGELARNVAGSLCGATVFDTLDSSEASYTIRLNMSAFRQLDGYTLPHAQHTTLRPNGWPLMLYATNGFLSLQRTADDFIREKIAGKTAKAHYNIFAMPELDHRRSNLVGNIRDTPGDNLGFYIQVAMMIITKVVVENVLTERETKIREGMQCMGLSDIAYYSSTYIIAGIWSFFTLGFAVIAFLCFPDLYQFTNLGMIYIFLWFCVLANISVGLFISVFSPKALEGKLLAMIFTMAQIFVKDGIRATTTTDAKNLMCLLPFCAQQLMIWTWMELEVAGLGVTASTAHIRIDGYSYNDALGMLVLDIFLFWLGYYYFDQILPHGVAHRSPKFPFTKDYWMSVLGKEKLMDDTAGDDPVKVKPADDGEKNEMIEDVSEVQLAMERNNDVLKIEGLKKVFTVAGVEFCAVDGIHLTMYRGEIFCLLGHNGAGKTTTINCLIGMVPCTAGIVKVYGRSLKETLLNYRTDLGVCPQHSVLWGQLSVLQHLQLFGSFKNLGGNEAMVQAQKVMSELNLTSKQGALANQLSGGMKRKLSLGMALMGNPSLCFLDEPTSGMDPTARRDTWDLLRQTKEGRIVILTTHYMDEADVLGDRVAIMAKGKVRCCGSGSFLKKLFNCGYVLTFNFVSKDDRSVGYDNEGKKVVEMVKGEITSICGPQIAQGLDFGGGRCRQVGTELMLLLDFGAAAAFEKLCATIEQKQQEYTISSWSISVCNLEEVFLRVASEGLEDEMKVKAKVVSDETEDDFTKKPPTGGAQIACLVKKRAIYARRDRITIVCQFFCPLFIVIFILGLLAAFLTGQSPNTYDVNHYNPEQEEGQRAPMSYGVVHPTLQGHADAYMAAGTGLEWQTLTEVTPLAYTPVWTPSGLKCGVAGYKNTLGGGRGGSSDFFCDPTELDAKGDFMGCMADGIMGCCNTTDTKSLRQHAHGFSCKLFDTHLDTAAAKYGAFLFSDIHVDPANSSKNQYGISIAVNTTGIHSAPTFFNVQTNLLLKSLGSSLKVKATGQPFGFTSKEIWTVYANRWVVFWIVLFLVYAYAFPPSVIAMYVVYEKSSGSKAQQLVSGVPVLRYWISNIIFDTFAWWVLVACVLVVLRLWGVDSLMVGRALGPTMILHLLFIFNINPFTYSASYLFTKPGGALIGVVMFNLVVVLLAFFLWIIFELVNEDTRAAALPLRWLFRFIPGFTFGEGIFTSQMLLIIFESNPPEFRDDAEWKRCDDDQAEFKVASYACARDLYDMQGVGGAILMQVLTTFLYFGLIIWMDQSAQSPGIRKKMDAMRGYTQQEVPGIEGLEDDDVLKEKADRENDAQDNPELTVHMRNIRKVYKLGGVSLEEFFSNPWIVLATCCIVMGFCIPCGCAICCAYKFKQLPGQEGEKAVAVAPSKKFVHAVRGTSLALRHGEVFGLLGVNGAGKTTTFKILAADIIPTAGTLWVGGANLQTDAGVNTARQRIGYCPQENGQLDILTVREHLEIFGTIKGIDKKNIKQAAQDKIAAMDLLDHHWKRAMNMSGGNRRKLMVAMAMMREPPLIFLDEPSAGMDPMARRFMWAVIQDISSTRAKSTVVLTTHSMEECEALCTRTCIMVNGVFRCLGTQQHIKSKYGQGYSVSTKLAKPSREDTDKVIIGWGFEPPQTDSGPASGQKRGSITRKASFSDRSVNLKDVREYCKDDLWKYRALESGASPFEKFAYQSGMDEKDIDTLRGRHEVSVKSGLRVVAEWYIIASKVKEMALFMKDNFPNIVWKEWHGLSQVFQIPNDDIVALSKTRGGGSTGLGPMFGLLEKEKVRLEMSEYTVAPTTLEEVFDMFARQQEDYDHSGGAGATGLVTVDTTAILKELLYVPKDAVVTEEYKSAKRASTSKESGSKEVKTPSKDENPSAESADAESKPVSAA